MASTMGISRLRISGAFAAATLALGLGACGSGNDNPSETSAQDSTATTAAAANDEPQGTPKEQVTAFLEGLRRDFIAGDGESFCNRLTAAGRRDAVQFSRQIRRGPTCEGFVRATAKAGREAGAAQPPTKITSIKVDGTRATAVIRATGQPPTTVKLVRRDGEWKLPDPGFSRALQNTAG